MKSRKRRPSQPLANSKSPPSCGGVKNCVAIGVPSLRKHPIATRNCAYTGKINTFLHAEMEALLDSQPGDVLEIMRWRANGTLSMAHPCPHCLKLICQKQIHLVRYTDWNGQWQSFEPLSLSDEDLAWWHHRYYSTRPRPAGWPLVSPGTVNV